VQTAIELYNMIFKRKSMGKFNETLALTIEDYIISSLEINGESLGSIQELLNFR